MAKGTVKTEDGATLVLDDLLRELCADAIEMPRMLGLAAIERHEPTELTFTIRTRGDQIATLKDGSVSHIEWQLKHDPNMGRRLVETYLGIQRRLRPKGPIHQVVIRVGSVKDPDPVHVDIAGARHRVNVLTGRDLDLEPLFASSHVSDRMIACLLTPNPARLIDVARGLRNLPEAERLKASQWFSQVAMFRQVQSDLSPEVLKMIDTVFEIDVRTNPLTRRVFAEAVAKSKSEIEEKVKLEGRLEGRLEERRSTIVMLLRIGGRDIDDTEAKLLSEMEGDELDGLHAAAVARAEDRTNEEALDTIAAALGGSQRPKP